MDSHYENYYSVDDESRDHKRVLDLVHGSYKPENWEELEAMLDKLEERFEKTAHEARGVEGRCARSEAELSLLHLHDVIMSLVRWTTYDALTHKNEESKN